MPTNSILKLKYFAISEKKKFFIQTSRLNKGFFISKILYFLFVFFYTNLAFSQAPTYAWVRNQSTSLNNESSYSIAIDSINKYIYSCGYIENSSAFIGLLSSEMNYGAGNGLRDGYLAKHDFNGNLIWVVNIGSVNNDEVRSVSYGIDGNIYITGNYQGSVAFKSFGSPNYTLTTTFGVSDVFTASYTSNGKIRWVKSGGGTQNEYVETITTTKNSVVVMGSYKNSANFGPYTTTALYNTRDNYFIVSYDFKGNELWLAEAKSDQDDGTGDPFIYSRSKIIYSNDTLFLIGEMAGDNMNFINSNGSTFGTVLTNPSATDNVFYSAISPAGNWLWCQKIQCFAGLPQLGFGISADCNGLYISGSIHPNATFASSYVLVSPDHDVPFMARCARSTGIDTWVKSWSSSSNHEDIAHCVFADGKGYLYVAGNFRSNNFFAPDGNLGAANGTEMFLAKYQTNGTFLWVQAIKGINNNYVNDFSISGNKVIMCGQFRDDISFPGLPLTSGFANENIYLTLGNLTSDPVLYNCCSSPPTAALTSPDQNICALTTTISANTPVTGTGNWYVTEGANSTGSGVFTNSATPTNTLTGLTVGTNIFTWVISNKLCNPSIDSIKIISSAPPSIAMAGSNQTFCASNPTTTMTGNTPTVGTGLWSVVSGTASITNPTLATTGITSISSGTNILQWTISNGACAPSTSTMSVIVDGIPTTAMAGPSQTLCASNPTTTMNGNVPTVGTGSWTVISGTASITNPTLATTGVTSISTGTNIFRWTISNSLCGSSSSTMAIIVDQQPTISNAGTNQTICASTPTTVMNGNIPGIGIGTWSLISGSASIISPNSPTSAIASLNVGTNVFQWSISNGVCPASTSSMSIVVDPVPTTALAGPNQTLCANSPTTAMNGNSVTVGTGLWTVITGTGAISSPSQPNTGITAIGTGTNIFEWAITSGVCPVSSSTVLVQVDQMPTIAMAGSSQTLCSGFYNMGGNTPSIGTGTWTLLSGSATITTPNNPNTSVTALGIGSNLFQWTIGNGVCPSSSSTVSITRDAVPTPANAGVSQTLCASNPTTNLAGNNPVVGTGLWTVISGTASITTPTLATSAVTAIASGTNTLEWTISNGVCPSSTSTMNIIVNQIPTTATAGSNQTLCAANPSLTMNGNFPSVGTGSWTVVSGSGSITTPTLANTTVNAIGTGMNIFNWTISNGVCAPSSATISVQIDQSPSPAVAGANQTLCASNPNTNMTGNVPIVGTGLWTVISGTGGLTAPGSGTTSVTAIATGVNVFEWAISNGVCATSTSTMSIQVDQIPTTAMAGSNQTLCASNPTFTMTGNTPGIGSGMWTVTSGTASITTPTLETSGVTGIAPGVNVFEWAISNGVCATSTSTMSIQVDQIPTTAMAGSNQTLCASNPTFTMTGNTPVIGSGMWTVTSGTASITTPTLETSGVTAIAPGVNIFEWAISNGVCATSTSTMSIQMDQIPTTAMAGSNQTLCASNPTFTMTGNTPVIGSGMWTVTSGTASITTPTLETSGVTAIAPGVNIFEWAISNGVCATSTSTMSIQVDQIPTTAMAGSNQTLCASNPTFTMTGNTPLIGTGMWTVTSGTASITTPTLETSGVTAIAPGVNIFEWAISNGVCATSTSTMSIQMDQIPTTAMAGSNQTLCASATTLNANNPTIGIGNWTVLTGTSSMVNPGINNSQVTGLNIGLNSYVWTIANGVCTSSTDTIDIYVSNYPDISVTGADYSVCETDTIGISANLPAAGIGSWSVIQGTGIIGSSTNNITTVTGFGFGDNIFRWTIVNAPCPNTSDDIKITVFQKPSIAYAGEDQLVFTDKTVLNANTPLVGNGNWINLNSGNSILNPSTPFTDVTNLNLGINIFIWQVQNGVCPMNSDTLIVTREDVLIPSGFSPNGDNVNDNFYVKGIEVLGNVRLTVFNRWGNIVYENDAYANNWNGKNKNGEELSDDTYYFILKPEKEQEIKGYVILKR